MRFSASVWPMARNRLTRTPMKFDTKTDPLVLQQQQAAERQNIESIRTGVKDDTDLKNRVFGTNILRRLSLKNKQGMTSV
jgi:hypothetical protein